MGEKTNISWCDHTFNPWRGCRKISSGCACCYAEKMARRNPKVLGGWGDAPRVFATDDYWEQPFKWNKSARRSGKTRTVFCGSLMDVFEDHPDLPGHRAKLGSLIEMTPHLTWLLLTKRPENAVRFLRDMFVRFWDDAPLPRNVWIGITIEDQAAANKRLIPIQNIPTDRIFLSCEPLLGRIDLSRLLTWARWIIVGGESGANGRPCLEEWIADVIDQRDRLARERVALFVKQMGSYWSDLQRCRGLTRDRAGANPAEWREDLRIQEFPF